MEMTLSISTNSSNMNSSEVAADSLPTSELSLLAKLEAANKLIESDSKSLNSLQGSVHSRKSSDTSQISLNSGSSTGEEDIWSTWASKYSKSIHKLYHFAFSEHSQATHFSRYSSRLGRKPKTKKSIC